METITQSAPMRLGNKAPLPAESGRHLGRTRRAQPSQRAVLDSANRTRTRIMVVEDEPDISELLTSVFGAEGYATVRALDAKTALDLARRKRPDAITLDLGLPDRDGHQLLHDLKNDSRTRDIPVIVVSAYSARLCSEDRRLVAAIVDKPFDLGELVRVLRNILAAGGAAST